MIVKYGTPAPAEIVDIKNVPSWVKAEAEKPKQEEESADSDKDEE